MVKINIKLRDGIDYNKVFYPKGLNRDGISMELGTRIMFLKKDQDNLVKPGKIYIMTHQNGGLTPEDGRGHFILRFSETLKIRVL